MALLEFDTGAQSDYKVLYSGDVGRASSDFQPY